MQEVDEDGSHAFPSYDGPLDDMLSTENMPVWIGEFCVDQYETASVAAVDASVAAPPPAILDNIVSVVSTVEVDQPAESPAMLHDRHHPLVPSHLADCASSSTAVSVDASLVPEDHRDECVAAASGDPVR